MDEDDRARFESVYRSTYNHLLGYAVRRSDRAEDAADVVAETYLIAWRRIADLPDGEHARMWLFGVAGKVIANHRRGQRREQRLPSERLATVNRLYLLLCWAHENSSGGEAIASPPLRPRHGMTVYHGGAGDHGVWLPDPASRRSEGSRCRFSDFNSTDREHRAQDASRAGDWAAEVREIVEQGASRVFRGQSHGKSFV